MWDVGQSQYIWREKGADEMLRMDDHSSSLATKVVITRLKALIIKPRTDLRLHELKRKNKNSASIWKAAKLKLIKTFLLHFVPPTGKVNTDIFYPAGTKMEYIEYQQQKKMNNEVWINLFVCLKNQADVVK